MLFIFLEKSGSDFPPQDLVRNIQIQKKINELKLVTTKGSVIDFKSKLPTVVILNFWASWCPPCLQELPSLNALAGKVASEDVKIIGINSDEDVTLESIRKIEKKYSLKFESVADPKGEFSRLLNIPRLPTTIFLIHGKVNFIVEEQEDFTSKKVKDLLERALKKKL
ncbi:MAG: TlpA family protein disulfide reductase [Bacteriovoracaceae bacterium]|nr:TlpA family protein disulfide reductase [Bacteriovoracaceae bacterium]